MKNHERIFYIILYCIYAVYILIFTGFHVYKLDEYINTLNAIMRLYVCGFLLYRFNPFRSLNEFSEFDRRIVFSSAMFLFLTISATQIKELQEKVRNDIREKKIYLEENKKSQDILYYGSNS